MLLMIQPKATSSSSESFFFRWPPWLNDFSLITIRSSHWRWTVPMKIVRLLASQELPVRVNQEVPQQLPDNSNSRLAHHGEMTWRVSEAKTK